MMRKTLSIFLLCLGVGFCFGQSKDDDDKKRPNGIRAGYQWSNMKNNAQTAASNLNAGYFGLVRNIRIVPLIHLETGLEYMLAGAQQTEDSKLQLHYLVLPVQGVLKIGPVVGFAGANANFRIAERLTINGQTVKRTRDDRSAAFDLAANVGAGFKILMLTLEARYYWGLLELENGWYNRYWQAGLKFNF